VRDPIYRDVADIVVDTSQQSVQRLVAQIQTQLDAFSRRGL
jgi:shikimate kinase